MFFKKVLTIVIALAMIVSLCACAAKTKAEQQPEAPAQTAPAQEADGPSEGEPAQAAAITVFAPESSVLFVMSAVDQYSKQRPSMTVSVSFDNSTVNTEKVISGYRCDLLIADDPSVIDFIDISSGKNGNPYDLDLAASDTRTDICTYTDEQSGETIEFSMVMLKQTGAPYEVQQFMKFMLDCGEDVYDEYGYSKAE